MGFPSKGTPADKRLSVNKPKAPKKQAPFGGKKAPPFKPKKAGKK